MNLGTVRLIALVLIPALLAAPCGALAADVISDDGQLKIGEMAADFLIVRPVGIATVIVGFSFFLVSSPFSALGGNIGEAWDTMVVKPSRFTFTRPLGDFER